MMFLMLFFGLVFCLFAGFFCRFNWVVFHIITIPKEDLHSVDCKSC